MGKRDDELFGGIQVDPGVAEAFGRSAARNRAAETPKQARDRKRVYQRVDMPAWLKGKLFAAAEGEDVSASQWSAFLLAWAMERWRRGDEGLRTAVAENKTLTRSLNAGHALVLDVFEETLCRVTTDGEICDAGEVADSAEGAFEGWFDAGGVDGGG